MKKGLIFLKSLWLEWAATMFVTKICRSKKFDKIMWGFYRLQRSCGKVMFLHVSVILSTGGVW